MRNNQLRTIKERTFRNLRGNIAILDVDGKRLGLSFRLDLSHSLCAHHLGNPIDCNCEMQWLSVWLQETNFPYPGPKCKDGRLLRVARMERSLCAGLELYNGGDNNERSEGNHLPLLNEHGDVFQRDLPEDFNDDCDAFNERPMVGESEYFYEQYVDSTDVPDSSNAVVSSSQRPKPTSSANPNIDLNNTLLHTKYFNRRPQPAAGAGSPFTFFGYPIPSLSLGRFFGFGERGRKQRTDQDDPMPATHRMAHINLPSGRGKTRMYQPNSAEFEKYLREQQQQQQHQPNVANARNRYGESEVTTNSGEEALSNESGAATTTGVFRTTFREPSSIERGGFRPIVPAHVGGFTPVHDPQQRRGLVEQVNVTSKPHMERHFVPIAVQQDQVQPRPKPTSGVDSSETATYEVTEMTPDITTQMPIVKSTRPMTTARTTSSTATTTTTTTTSSSTTEAPMTSASSEQQMEDSQYDDEDLEAQSVTLLRPPKLYQPTTAETILLIPPPEEHVAQIKSHSWITTTTEAITDYKATPSSEQVTAAPARGAGAAGVRTPGGRSTITKVYTSHQQQQQQQLAQPTAEEYQRTTPSADNESFASEQQVIRQAQKRTDILPDLSQVAEPVERKDGMDWYYESFKKKRDFTDHATAVNTPANKEVLYGNVLPELNGCSRWSQPGNRYLILLVFLLLGSR